MTILEEQVREWRQIYNMFNDARRMTGQKQADYLSNEVHPKLREYLNKYDTSPESTNKPK